MKCQCGSEKSKVTDTRQAPTGAICRRRKCEGCGDVFWTGEIKLNGTPDYYMRNDKRLPKEKNHDPH